MTLASHLSVLENASRETRSLMFGEVSLRLFVLEKASSETLFLMCHITTGNGVCYPEHDVHISSAHTTFAFLDPSLFSPILVPTAKLMAGAAGIVL